MAELAFQLTDSLTVFVKLRLVLSQFFFLFLQTYLLLTLCELQLL